MLQTITGPDPALVTVTAERAIAVAASCDDAYSFDAYGESGWRSAAKMLARHGCTEQQIIAVLRSKWTRWAGDAATFHNKRYGHFNGRDLERFIESNNYWAEIPALTRETFSGQE